jgi:hypothetical protein
METTNELLHLDKWSFVQWKIIDILTIYILIIIFFDDGFKYENGAKF